MEKTRYATIKGGKYCQIAKVGNIVVLKLNKKIKRKQQPSTKDILNACGVRSL